MPKIIVEISYDQPDDPYWMNPDTIAMILHSACRNTKFEVKWAKRGNPWKPKLV